MLFAGFNVPRASTRCGRPSRSARWRTSSARGSPTRVGYFGRIELLEKHGKALHIKPSHLAWADRWFERYGALRRVLRAHAADHPHLHLAAGRRGADAVLEVLRADVPGCLPWVFLLTFTGKQVGARTGTDWKDSLHYVDYAVAALDRRRRRLPVVRWWRRRRTRAAADARPEPRCACATRWRSACCTARPSCCRSPPRATSRSSRGCWAGSTPTLEPELRKAFEVALHAGTAAALLVALRDEVAAAARGLDRRRATLVAAARSCRRPSLGYTLERPIERRLGTPATIAVGLLVGSAAMAAADRFGPHGPTRARRPAVVDAPGAGGGPGVRADAGRLAQRHDAGGGAAARLRPRGRQRALAPRGAADHRRRDRAEGRAPGPARRPAGAGERLRGRRRAPPSSPRWARCG